MSATDPRRTMSSTPQRLTRLVAAIILVVILILPGGLASIPRRIRTSIRQRRAAAARSKAVPT